MTLSKIFWGFLMVCTGALYLVGLGLLLFTEWKIAGEIIIICVVLLHLAESNTALKIGREHGLSDAVTMFMNMAFGFTWWLPLKNGIFD
jgi:hypothetical protein